jgi:hypothetical protein
VNHLPACARHTRVRTGGAKRGVWCVVCGVWCVVRGAWCVVTVRATAQPRSKQKELKRGLGTLPADKHSTQACTHPRIHMRSAFGAGSAVPHSLPAPSPFPALLPLCSPSTKVAERAHSTRHRAHGGARTTCRRCSGMSAGPARSAVHGPDNLSFRNTAQSRSAIPTRFETKKKQVKISLRGACRKGVCCGILMRPECAACCAVGDKAHDTLEPHCSAE